MGIRRRSLQTHRTLDSQIQSYFRNPTPDKRRTLILRIKEAMISVEKTKSSADASHRLLSQVLEELDTYFEAPETPEQDIVLTEFQEMKTAPTDKPKFEMLSRAFSGNPELERQLRHLLDAIMRGNRDIKIDDAKEIMGIDNTTYVRRLLERLIKREFLKASGKTKARKYTWTGKYPPWTRKPKERALTSCSFCGTEMQQRGNMLKCPRKGCKGKAELPEKVIKVTGQWKQTESDASLISKILNAIKPEDYKELYTLKKDTGITEEKILKLVKKRPELVVKDNRVYRKSDILFECPGANRKFFSVNFGTRLDGTQPAREGWESLNNKARNYFIQQFKRMCEHGLIQDGQKFKPLEEGVWQFKANAYKRRLTCFMHSRKIFLLSLFKKKEDDTKPHEIKFAVSVMEDTLARMHNAGYRYNPDDSVRAEAVYAWREDIGKQKIRIPKLVRRALDVGLGDPVKVIGPSGSLILKATIADRSEIGVFVAGIDGNDRETLGVEIGDEVTLENPHKVQKAKHWLFSYGSNNPDQLMQRLGHRVSGISAAYIKNYRLKFLGYSQRRQGGVAGLVKKSGSEACGYVCRVSDQDLEILDVAEGVAGGYYQRKTMPVLRDVDGDFEVIQAVVYMPGPRRLDATEHFCPSQEYLDNLRKTIFTFWDHNECQDYLDEALDEVC